MMNMKIGVEVVGFSGAHRKCVRIQKVLAVWLLLVVLPGLAVAAEDEAKEQAPESDTSADSPAEKGEVSPEPTVDEKPVVAAPESVPVPVADDTSVADPKDAEVLPATPSPGREALRRALDTVSELQLLLASSHDGDGPVRGHEELAKLRRSLEDALVEVTRLEQQQDLRQWLQGDGLRAAMAEVEADRSLAKAEAVQIAVPIVEVEVEESEPVAVDGARLRAVKRAIEDAPFKEGKMQVLTEQLRDTQVSSEQVGELIQLFAFSRDKVETLVFLYPRLVDPDRFDELLSTLKFASDRLAVRQRLGLSGS
jgi:hypothetical protein